MGSAASTALAAERGLDKWAKDTTWASLGPSWYERQMARMITEDNLGAWLIKCDPKIKYDLPGDIAAGNEVVWNWSVTDNYRSRMMTPGHKVILWVSGDGRVMERGIWGTGWVSGYVQDTVPEDLEPGEVSFWHDEKARLAVTNDIDVYIPLFDEAVTAADIEAAGVTDLEVQTMAANSNPSWVSKQQLIALEHLVGEWPDKLDPEDEITVSEHGTGFGDPHQNQIVERAAMEAVTVCYEADDWEVEDVSLDKVGWDLTCTHKTSGERAGVEVKGLSGDRPVVLLTGNEIRAASEEPGWVSAVVTRALSNPTVVEYTAEAALTAAKPYLFKADLSG